ncbi:N-acyl-L-amino-acid amidohydrolase, partial [Necator americanus]
EATTFVPIPIQQSSDSVLPQDQWKYDPYAAHKDENGDIYARGAQDMKCVGSQYVEAIRRHFQRGRKQWLRTIHILWGADEEIAGEEGMARFCQMDEFEQLNIGFVLDEGIASETNQYNVFYAERCPWWLKVTCTGSPGHGSKFIPNTAAEKLQKMINKTLSFREEQKKILEEDPKKTLGDVTTLNLTIIEGGVQVNVLPEKYTAYFDIRVPPTVDFDSFGKQIDNWCREAGEGVQYEFLEKNNNKNMTPTTADDPWWNAFEKSLQKQKCEFTTGIFTGATDSRFIRALGYRSIGFSPMNNTPSLLHDHNEYLNEKVYLRGIEIYETLIDNLANVEE